MTRTTACITQRDLNLKILLRSVPSGSHSCDLPTLEEVLTSLENGFPAKPSSYVVACILHACRRLQNQQISLRLHAYMLKVGMEAHPVLGNRLVSLLAEVGSIGIAGKVFDQLSHRTASSWNSLITGYLKLGATHRAFALYEDMLEHSVHPSGVNFVALLKACAKLPDFENGCRLHSHVAQLGLLEKDAFLGSTLVDMYAKCGYISRAQEVLGELPIRSVVAWTALIGGYVKKGCDKEALNCYDKMIVEDLSPDVVTYTCCVKACSSIRDADKGQELHAEVARRGFLERDLLVGSSFVDMYARCGLLTQAQEMFDKLPYKDVVSWTAIISGYTDHGCSKQALEYFEQMQLEGVLPNSVTFACSLKACASVGAIAKGQEIHEELAKRGLTETDQLVANALIDMYAKSGLLSKARSVLENLLVRDLVSWNALISGYAMHGHGREALNTYEQMQVKDGIIPDDITLVCCLKACGSLCAVEEGLFLHAETSRRGLLERDHVGNVLVDMYVKCGFLSRAEDVLDELPCQSAVSWNSLISGYIKHGCYEEAMNTLGRMHSEGVVPDVVTHVCRLKACGNMGLTEKGEEMHREFSKEGLFERDSTLGNALVDMYVKCGLLLKAKAAFDKLPSRDIIAWTSLISGHGQVGNYEDAIYLFNKMRKEGVEPNLVTFVGVLNACSRAGQVHMGEAYLEAMAREYGIIPKLEHYTCMVDLLSRAGQIKKAVALIEHMPFHPDLVIWHTMLGVGQQWGSLELGSQAFKHAVPLDAKDPLVYIFLSNIYADYRTEYRSSRI